MEKSSQLKIKTGFVIEKLLFRAHGDKLNSWWMITMMILIVVKALDMMMGRSRFSVVVERSLTVGWQSLDRVSMNHLVCPLIPTSHPLPSQTPLKACKPQQVTAHQDVKTLCSFLLSPGESAIIGRAKRPASSEEVDLPCIRSTTGG